MRKTIGLLGGAFKPFHKGHMASVEKAANECDVVYLFVSTGNRIKKDQFPIEWNDMRKVWDLFLINAMPKNVIVTFVENPITSIFDKLSADSSKAGTYNTFNVYASEEDLRSRFSAEKMLRLFPDLVANDQIVLLKTGTRQLGFSGTQMRKNLQDNNLEGFVEGLPGQIQKFGHIIWKLLKK